MIKRHGTKINIELNKHLGAKIPKYLKHSLFDSDNEFESESQSYSPESDIYLLLASRYIIMHTTRCRLYLIIYLVPFPG